MLTHSPSISLLAPLHHCSETPCECLPLARTTLNPILHLPCGHFRPLFFELVHFAVPPKQIKAPVWPQSNSHKKLYSFCLLGEKWSATTIHYSGSMYHRVFNGWKEQKEKKEDSMASVNFNRLFHLSAEWGQAASTLLCWMQYSKALLLRIPSPFHRII